MKVLKSCAGPGIRPKEKPCPISPVFHRVEESNDVKPYNGIINWRCPFCFEEHRKQINMKTA